MLKITMYSPPTPDMDFVRPHGVLQAERARAHDEPTLEEARRMRVQWTEDCEGCAGSPDAHSVYRDEPMATAPLVRIADYGKRALGLHERFPTASRAYGGYWRTYRACMLVLADRRLGK